MTTYPGRLGDGKTAGSSPVTVTLARALEIRPAGDAAAEPVETWAFHRLEAAVPVTRSSADVLLRSRDHTGQTLFVADSGFAAALLRVAPHLSPGVERWRYAKPGLAVALLLATIVGVVWLLELSPATTIARMLPDTLRHSLGEQAAESLAGGRPVCRAEPGLGALHKLVAELSEAAGSGQTFSVRVVEWDLENAFAVPGENIVISSGLIDAAKSPDEVAGVIAHEMGHGIALHPEAGIIRALGIAAGMELIFTGSSGTLTNIGAMLVQLRYSRSAEREADAEALRILKEARISPKPLAEFFDRLSGETGGDGADGNGVGALFSTHPASPERARLAAEAATYEARPAMTEAEWQALRSICAGGTG